MKKKDTYLLINPELIEWLEPILCQYVLQYRKEKAIELIQRIKEKFFCFIKHDNKTGCDNYSKKLNKYYNFYYGPLIIGVHRLAYLLNNKDKINSKEILHNCDNGSCVNYKHLRKGTHDENMKDKIGKKNKIKHYKINDFIKMQILVQYYGMRLYNKSLLSKTLNVSTIKISKVINENKDFVYDYDTHNKYLLNRRHTNENSID
jgi:hypothetical protein